MPIRRAGGDTERAARAAGFRRITRPPRYPQADWPAARLGVTLRPGAAGLRKGRVVFVDPNVLRSGTADSDRAAQHAQAGAAHLVGAQLPAGMFGDLSAAHTFHQTLTEAHAQHIETSRAHRETLARIRRQAHQAADGFTTMEQHNTAAMGAVGREPR
ncbi:MAG TPA: DUF2563 family protein [Mycobacterium sp.]